MRSVTQRLADGDTPEYMSCVTLSSPTVTPPEFPSAPRTPSPRCHKGLFLPPPPHFPPSVIKCRELRSFRFWPPPHLAVLAR